MTGGVTQRVRGNDWSTLVLPESSEDARRLPVSVVIPAYDAGRTLPYTLAALAAQTYPGHLLEVVVVLDGAEGNRPVTLPELRPENTRTVTVTEGWGRANACHQGALAADGVVLHWLDADMVPTRDEVALQLRWHEALDHAVVLGHKLFVDAQDLPSVKEVHAAVHDDRVAELFDGRWVDEHSWVEAIWHRTRDLTTAGFRAFHVHVGATASVRRDLYLEAGGMATELKLGEDIELGYRLTGKGAVFVAERGATSWHLGRSTLMQHEQQVQRYNAPFNAARIPDFRKFREDRGRSYAVPYLEVVVQAEHQQYEAVKHTIDGVLAAVPHDLTCRLVGPWRSLTDERRRPLEDELLDLRLIHEEYSADPRVHLVEQVGPTAFPAQFRMHLPAGWSPGRTTLATLLQDMQKRSLGLRLVLFPDGHVARLERTAAFERALRVREPDEDLDDVVDAVSGSWWSEADGDGFRHHDRPPPSTGRRQRPTAAPRDQRGDLAGSDVPQGRSARRWAAALRRRG